MKIVGVYLKAAGVVVEYNPFHNGHLYHLEETKRETKADCVIAVMSGNFLQRGEPALVSKWVRTKMALEAGIDIVVELPYAFATQKAETFANGAISILEALSCEQVCFGSEHGTLEDFVNTVDFMKENSQVYSFHLQNALKEGVSYPRASSIAYKAIDEGTATIDLSKPNNILGYHYVKAIFDQHAAIKPTTIQRTGANYHDQSFSSPSIASATSIRKALFEGDIDLEKVKSFIPESTIFHLHTYKQAYGTFHEWEDYFDLLKYSLLTVPTSELVNIYEVEEGIEYRLVSEIRQATSFKEFMTKIKTKRYTWTRLQRLCLHILTHTTKQQMREFTERNTAKYIRLLGMSDTGQHYLNSIKKHLPIPLVSNVSSVSTDDIFLDVKATLTYSMILPEPTRSNFLKLEYSTPPIRYDKEKKTFSH